MAQDVQEPRGRGPYENELLEAIWRKRTTIKAVADAIGASRQDTSEIVNGWRLPSAEQFDGICEVLGWTREQLYPKSEFRDAIEATRKKEVA